MKQINYSGSSKLISRIVYLLNRKAPLPLDGDGDPSWGTNGQVLTTDGTGATYWSAGGGGDVTDVEVNGTSVVNAQGVAEVSVPTKTSNLNNDSDFIDSTDLSTALAGYTPTANLATVATSGDYDDLTNKPTIPAAQVNSDWNAASGVAQILNKPTIPTVNDGTLTIQQNGTTVGTFSANQSGNTTVNLTGGGGSTYTEGDGINISAQNAISVDTVFTEASTRANIASGDSLSTIWGKIKKFFSDLKTVAFSGSYNDLSDKPTIPTDFVSKANGGTFGGTVVVDGKSGTTSSYGMSFLMLGNNIPLGTDKNSFGALRFYGGSSFYTDMSGVNATGNRTILLPDADGTIAITSSAVGGLFVESFTHTSLSSGFVNVSKTGYKPVFAMVTNLPALVACRGIMWDGSTYYLRLEQWNSDQTWAPYTTATSCNIVAGYVPN